VFIAPENGSAYLEFNFAPSCEWTLYSFRGYRDGAPSADESIRPEIAVRSADTLELDATIQLDRLPVIDPHAPLRIGLSAVIEASDGFTYWALRHQGQKPDFHDAYGFALSLEPPAKSSC
jgi:hypothetical protein